MNHIKNTLFIVLTLAMNLNITARSNDEGGKFGSGLHQGYTGEEKSNARGLRGFAGRITGATVAVPATVVGADTRYKNKNRKADDESKAEKSNKKNKRKNKNNSDQ